MRGRELVKKGISNPTRIPPYLLGQLFPDSRWGPEWRRENGFVTFRDGGFAGGSPNRPELSARIYHEVSQIRKALGGREYDRSLEIGCGYGRLSGWIGEYADEAVAIEPNAEVLEQAEALYPDVEFHEALAGDLPFPDGSFDLLVSWSVLTHVDPEMVERATAELKRVLTPDATVLLCEQTAGERSPANWPRSPAEYEELFTPYRVVSIGDRSTEPNRNFGEFMETKTMVLRQ